jgi:hypothetical protein
MYFGSDESALGAFLHRFIFGFTRFEQGDVFFCSFLDYIGSYTVEGFEDVVEGKGGIGFGTEDAVETEVPDAWS